MRKNVFPALILVLVISGCGNSFSGNQVLQIIEPRATRDQYEVRAKWNQYKPTDTGSVYYAQTPNVTVPYAAGALTGDHLNDGLNMTKFVRYLAGLSEEVYLDSGLNDQAQHGAVLLAALDQLTHSPSKPADMGDDFYQKGKASCGSSNLFYVSTKYNLDHAEDLDRAVRMFIHDTDIANISRVGHRRWVLHPSLQKIGFGLADRSQSDGMHAYYATMQITDTGNKTDKVDMHYVAWPGRGYFPDEFFSGVQAWSVNLNPNVYDISKCRPEVTLINVTTGRKWVFSDVGDTTVPYKFFYFNRENAGWPGCVIFRPDGLESMSSTENLLTDNTFTVTVTGLIKKDGTPGRIAYEVTFFTL
jgi:hypothetical protein